VRNLLVLWDIDYTLIDAGGTGRAVYASVFRDLFGRDADGVAPMGGRTERAIILDTLATAGISDPARHVDAFVAELTRRAPELRATFEAHGHVLPGAAAALAALAALGPAVVQSVLTGNVPAMARAKLAAFGLDGHLDLDVGAYGDHHEVRAELVHLARRLAGAAYGRDFGGQATVLVGDTPLDVAAALATGARAVGVATGGTTAGNLAAAGAHAVLPGLTDTAATLRAVLSQPSPPASPAAQNSLDGPAAAAGLPRHRAPTASMPGGHCFYQGGPPRPARRALNGRSGGLVP
jgi:phosphoglycolate phosphatase